MIQILIYAGAIVVLFVFVVMLLNLERPVDGWNNWFFIAAAGAGSWFFLFFLLRVLSTGNLSATSSQAPTLRVISKLLFTRYLWPFEILTLFLLALIVGIYLVARPEREQGETP